MGIDGFGIAIAYFSNLIVGTDGNDVISRPSDCRSTWRIWILGIDLGIKDCLIGSH